MKRITSILSLILVLAACGTGDGAGTSTVAEVSTTTSTPATTTTQPTTTTADPGFPVTVEADNGSVTIESSPEAIVSLSSTATEQLFAIGAGSQVVAVDEQSNYPSEAPTTDLSGFTPNVEAILAYDPDLVIITFDPGDLVASLEAADVPVISFTAAASLDDVYRQFEALGQATGHAEEAVIVSEQIENDIAKIVADAPALPDGTSYFYEIDNTLYTATSSTFFGQIIGLFGLENIGDAADADGAAFGYPQLSSEYVVAQDPDLIFLADVDYGESAESVASRPGWDVLTAVQQGHIYGIDADLASRWGPRVVDFTEAIADALVDYSG